MRYYLVPMNKNCYFSLEKGSLNPTGFLEFSSNLSQRHSQAMLFMFMFNSSVESAKVFPAYM